MLSKKDFLIGQIVVCKHAGNKARHNEGISFGKVIKLTNKYVTVSFNDDDTKGIKFILQTTIKRDYLLQKTEYSGDYEMFPSEQAYKDYEEKESKLDEIRSVIGQWRNNCDLSVDQVRDIYDIIKEEV